MADRARIEALLSEGLTQTQVAGRMGISQQTVSRTLAEHHEAEGSHPTQDAVDAFVESLGVELSPVVLARIAALRNVARQLDWAEGAGTGSAAMATSALNKEYVAHLEALQQAASLDELAEALRAADD